MTATADGVYGVLVDALGDAGVASEPGRSPDPWESKMQATCECLSWRGTLDHLARRHAEDDLGETVYADFPDHTKSAVVTAHVLLDEGIITEDELRAKMKEVRERFDEGRNSGE
ncbi:MAG: hypothetical protein QOD63_1561 [Actinomycetota bacterium]|nr:hypothetical protein [Actinomycetota bacterium]